MQFQWHLWHQSQRLWRHLSQEVTGVTEHMYYYHGQSISPTPFFTVEAAGLILYQAYLLFYIPIVVCVYDLWDMCNMLFCTI